MFDKIIVVSCLFKLKPLANGESLSIWKLSKHKRRILKLHFPDALCIQIEAFRSADRRLTENLRQFGIYQM